MKHLPALFFLIIFFASCGANKAPEGVIPQEKMTDVLTDIHLADGYASVNYTDSGKAKVAALYQAVYKKYDTDSVQVRKSLEYYTKHPDVLQLIYKDITARIETLTRDAQKEDERRYKEQQARIRDSLFYHDKRLDSLNHGFRIDTLPYWPFEKFVVKKK
ncbi:DUF4296 domain-containing protein [Arcticibacter sp. MXS-1]|uniref:DUF4296 domain-containing protein n=1 Tax=Arcticibacter sp. MXS-1 TaxID=3341726 RepID=UPI0035A883D2